MTTLSSPRKRGSIKRIACPYSPEKVFSVFAGEPDTALLHSSMRTDAGRFSFIGLEPFLVFSTRGDQMEIKSGGRVETRQGDPFEALRAIFNEYRVANDTPLPFTAGGIGYFSYDLKNMIEKLPRKAVDEVGMPDIRFVFYRTILIFDAEDPGYVTASSFDADGTGSRSLEKLASSLSGLDTRYPIPDTKKCGTQPEITSNFTKQEYLSAIEKTLEHIKAGDIYQLCLTQRFKTAWENDPYELYLELNGINPAPFSAYLNAGDLKIISSSPELFLRRRGDTIETRPMKGTRPRGATSRDDARIRLELEKSQKDISELLMIVDLERNDLGRIAIPGSVEVAEHRRIEAYPTVFQTIAVVKGKLESATDNIDIIKATFPGGSITGCPKIRAMEIIDELEPTARGVYTGAIGYLSFHDTMDLNIAIRTMVAKGKDVYFQAGGGIVSDSEAEAEYEETLVKARALVESLGSREHRAQTVHNIP